MAAVKRKSADSSSSEIAAAKKPHKSKKGKETGQKKKKGTDKTGQRDEIKKPKLMSIAFPEEGKIQWNEIRKQSKQLTEARKQKKLRNSYESIQEAKRKFEIFRNRKCKGEERDNLIAECAQLMKGLLSDKAKSHDVARLVQWLLKLGSKDVKTVVVDEVINDVVTLAKCKYANHIVKNIVVSCDSTIRRRLIPKLIANVVKLLSSKIAAPIVEDVYVKYANSSEKASFRRELYGELCKPLFASNDNFASVLKENPSLAPSILSGLKKTLSKLLQKNWLLSSSIVLSVLRDYLSNCEDKDRNEIFELLKGHLLSMIKTKAGVDISLIILKNSTAKEKKEIVKEVKGDIANIAGLASGSSFLQHLIDSVDDTVLMKKALSPIVDSADDLLTSESGRKFLSYIVAHRDGHFFHPSDVDKLKSADDSVFVKKNSATRMKELQEAFVPVLLSKIGDNPKIWLKDGCTCLLTASVISIGSQHQEQLTAAFEGISRFLTNLSNRLSRTTSSTNDVPVFEDPAVNKTIKKIIKDDKSRVEKGETTFSQTLVDKLSDEVIDKWSSTNRGCFLLVFLIESGIDDVVQLVKSKIKSADIKSKLEKFDFKGAEILVQLL